MRLFQLVAVTLALGPAAFSVSVGAQSDGGPSAEARSPFEARADWTADGASEITAHLTDVIAELQAADVSRLDPGQLGNRAEMIESLADYVREGRFPVNLETASPTPIFIDSDGRACAVGHLMITSGAADLACSIAASSNFAYLPEITAPGSAEWMERVGLTADECALIQPSYGPCGSFNNYLTATSSCTPTVPNSLGLPAQLIGCGSNELSFNNMFIVVEGLPEATAGYFLSSQTLGFVQQPGGSQGTLCLGGSIGRHTENLVLSVPNIFFGPGWINALFPDLTDMPSPNGRVHVMAGQTWHFQYWYRDANPEVTSNFSDVMSATFM